MEAGHLVGDDIILGVVREELAKPEAAKGVIFDGVVRTIPQAEGMERILAEQKRQMDAVLFFEVTRRGDPRPSGTAPRASRSRADDDPAAVATGSGRTATDRAGPGMVRARGAMVHRVPAIGTVDEIAASARQVGLVEMITLKSARGDRDHGAGRAHRRRHAGADARDRAARA